MLFFRVSFSRGVKRIIEIAAGDKKSFLSKVAVSVTGSSSRSYQISKYLPRFWLLSQIVNAYSTFISHIFPAPALCMTITFTPLCLTSKLHLQSIADIKFVCFNSILGPSIMTSTRGGQVRLIQGDGGRGRASHLHVDVHTKN